MSQAGRIALVTAATRGIGRAIAQRLVADGARVCITARHADAVAQAVAELNEGADADKPQAMGVAGSADDPQHRAETVRQVTERFGPIHLLVNNAGISPPAGPLVDLDLDAARKTLDVNLIGALGWVQEVHRTGWAERGGAIVNISSVSATRSSPGIALYGVSKAALSHLTANLAVELGPTIRVNAIAPAVVKTDFAQPLYDGREERIARNYPLQRLGVPADVAGAAAFLLSDDAAWVTGQTLVLDGGVMLVNPAA